jgi:hypothetical protein
LKCPTRRRHRADKAIGDVRHAMSPCIPLLLGLEPTAPSSAVGNICYMKILNLIHVMFAQAFYSWAVREINPLHPDVPRIILRRQELADKARRVFA